ncbi:MAG: DUF4007 family protein [Pontiellaceae bacterium]|nr:DUF4007 family protein [Pontiellaceae bacterium]MBN2785199.1 DUF4007 family protein [Pontiellaceae bacterium]
MDFKFSGHETFAFRYAWLPKAYNAVKAYGDVFSDEDQAMVLLGVGKNMVRSIRFWALLLGIIESHGGRAYEVTPFGGDLLDPIDGLDPYLEDSQTLWLLHWRLSTAPEPLFAWHYLLNRWQESEMVGSVILPMMIRDLEGSHKLSKNSLDSMLSVFLHTYVPTRGKKNKVVEDNLDCPLVQLRLIEYAGDRDGSFGRKEPIYTFRRGEKPEISLGLFLYCLTDYWCLNATDERTLSFEQIVNDIGSPGQILKLSGEGIQERLNDLGNYSDYFVFTDSSTSRSLERKFDDFDQALTELLREIYE